MSDYKFKPGIRAIPLVSLEPATILGNVVTFGVGGLDPNFTYTYHIYSSRDGAGGWCNQTPLVRTITPPVSPPGLAAVAVVLNMELRAGQHHFWAFRNQPSDPGTFALAAVSDGIKRRDPGTGKNYMQIKDRVPWVDPTATAGSVLSAGLDPDLLRVYSLSLQHDANPVQPLRIEIVRVTDVVYEDQSDVGDEDTNGRLIAKERGVRCRVELEINVEGGSTSEKRLAQMYGAKMAYPDMRLEFSLNSATGANVVWKECRIDGNYTRTPLGNVQSFVEMNWTIMMRDRMDSIPFPVFNDGSGFW